MGAVFFLLPSIYTSLSGHSLLQTALPRPIASTPLHRPCPPSLFRFDLIYLVLDKVEEERDRRLARHLVSLFHAEEPVRAQQQVGGRVLDARDPSTVMGHCLPGSTPPLSPSRRT